VTSTVAVPEVPAHFVSAFTRFSIEIQQDGTRLVEILQEILTDALVQKQEVACATGTGVGEPEGLVTGLAAVAASVVAPTTAETYGKLDPIKIQNSLDPRWQQNASFLASMAILNETAVFELSTGGSILYPDVRNGRMLGRDVREWSLLDSVYSAAATAAHNYLLAYGDWKKAYLIADRIGSSFEVVPHLFNASGNPTGERGAWLYARTGGGVIVPEAGRLLDIPTTA
jgi:HK97 family phage major capsid protein